MKSRRSSCDDSTPRRTPFSLLSHTQTCSSCLALFSTCHHPLPRLCSLSFVFSLFASSWSYDGHHWNPQLASEMSDFKVPINPVPVAILSHESDPKAQPLVYNIPFWSDVPPAHCGYQLEVISSGCVQQTLPLDAKPFYLIGRAPICDIVIDNDVCYHFHPLSAALDVF